MDLIQQFIDTYKMKWTFYDAAGRLAAEKLQLALQNAGIRAIVTSRAKNPARLRTKVQRRNSRREERKVRGNAEKTEPLQRDENYGTVYSIGSGMEPESGGQGRLDEPASI